VSTFQFVVSGSFFSQQNGITNVCAHAALRWLLNNLPERAESIITYEDINEMLGIDHITKKADNGLSIENLIDVITKHDYSHLLAKFEESSPTPYWKFTYSIIESGYPVLIIFETTKSRHVICAIGHTFNSDIWDAEAKLVYSGAPDAKYISSASWADHFVIHDDNYGMYFCLPTKALLADSDRGTAFKVIGALGIVPTDIELAPLEVELYASVILGMFLEACSNDLYWIRALKAEKGMPNKWVIFRTFLASKTDYEKHLENIEDNDSSFLKEGERRILLSKLPSHFWVIEFSLTDLYTSNKHKLGEILYNTKTPAAIIQPETETGRAFSGCLAARLPGTIIIPEEGEISIMVYDTKLSGHVDLMRTCNKSPCIEW